MKNSFLKNLSGENQWYLYVVGLVIVYGAMQLGYIPFVISKYVDNIHLRGDLSAVEKLIEINGTKEFTLALLSFVVGFFALFCVIKYIHKKSYLDIVTARPTFDFYRMGFAMLVWGILLVGNVVLNKFISHDSTLVYQFDVAKFLPLLIVSLIFLPFQIGLEELVFRGYLLQWGTYLTKNPWISVIVTSILFGFMHMFNPEVERFGMILTMPSYIMMGFVFALLTKKDDGIEFAVGMHLINNLFFTLFVSSDISVFQTDAVFTIRNASITFMDTVIMFIASAVFLFCVHLKYKIFRRVE